ncbi:hypothetical protein EYF80_060857 [Liparis tanakae]|uniref:Uncharacterized protein n=1 Tax=Liparis tanakae TaxID=230148 RepID=A0A4Z2EJR2_9TELE|nr:hypothetical protein EYF80_060857 [Liparis tanakae]
MRSRRDAGHGSNGRKHGEEVAAVYVIGSKQRGGGEHLGIRAAPRSLKASALMRAGGNFRLTSNQNDRHVFSESEN